MTKGFMSVGCEGCIGSFRNRQALGRHQKKTGCIGRYRLYDEYSPLQSSSTNTVIPTVKVDLEKLTDLFQELDLKLASVVRGRYFDDVKEINGISRL
jgi:hypothetical protein